MKDFHCISLRIISVCLDKSPKAMSTFDRKRKRKQKVLKEWCNDAEEDKVHLTHVRLRFLKIIC